jgi:type I restriction enzyme M protein
MTTVLTLCANTYKYYAKGVAKMAKRHVNRAGDLESLFLRLEELVLANSGEDEFEEIFKLLIAKLWDEKSSRGSRFRIHSGGKTVATICELLREANKEWPGILDSTEPALSPEHLEVCVDALSVHTISDNDLQVLDGFFEFLVSRTAKASKGQYFTPRHVIELCVQMMQPRSDKMILDPACGSGGFLIHALNYIRSHEGLPPQASHEFCAKNLWGFDIDDRAVRVAKTLMVLAGDGSANIIRLNSLLKPSANELFSLKNSDEPSLTVEDVCRSRLRKHKGFDLILTNPPFAGEVREKQLLNSYTLAKNKNRVERDTLFVERCVQLLKPGGRLAIVLPHNKFAANSLSHLREWVLRNARVIAVVSLGRHTFLPHTHQKASILFLQRNVSTDDPRKDYRIFFAISERDGKSSKGQLLFRDEVNEKKSLWLRIDHDFEEIIERFKDFCRKESLMEV